MTSLDESRQVAGLPFVLDEQPGPALPLSPEVSARVVNDVLALAYERPPATSRWNRRRGVLLLAASFVLLTMTAIAAGILGRGEPMREEVPVPTSSEDGVVVPLGPQETSIDLDEEEQTEAIEHDAEPRIAVPPVPRESPDSESTAKERVDLLQHANRLRARQRWVDAERTYQQVIDQHPGTPEAYAASVAAASIRLEHLGDPKGAKDLYESAIEGHPGGGLAQEADFGVAEAHRAAGNFEAEEAALRAFLEKYPQSPLRSKVQARLRELAAPRKKIVD